MSNMTEKRQAERKSVNHSARTRDEAREWFATQFPTWTIKALTAGVPIPGAPGYSNYVAVLERRHG